jgi:hypothetical protein
VRTESFPQPTDARREETAEPRPGSLQQRRELPPSHEGEKRQSDEVSSSKRQRIDFATRQYQLHEQQQGKGKELDPLEAYDKAGPSHHPRQLDQLEQKLLQRAEAPHQVGQTDIIRLMKQIEVAPLTWERRREKLKCLIQSYQSPEQGQAILPQRHEGQDQAGPSHHGNAQRESISEQKRTWITEELHQLVDEMVQIKDFNHKTFQTSLSDESQAICEQLNKYGRSLNDQEWMEIKARFGEHKVFYQDKRYKYLRTRTETTRNLQKQRELAADVKAKQQGFKNRHERLSRKKQRLNGASEL